MKMLASLFIVLLSTSAFAAMPEGTFSCKNIEGLPNNTYKIARNQVGGGEVPYVEAHRFVKMSDDQNAATEEIVLKGFGLYHQRGEIERVILGGLTFEFKDGVLQNCRE